MEKMKLKVQIEQLEQQLQISKNETKEKVKIINEQRDQVNKAQARAKHAQNQLDKQNGEFESVRENLTKGFQQAQKKERQAKKRKRSIY